MCSAHTSVIVVDCVELIVKEIGNGIEFLVVLDGDEDLLTVLLAVQAKDHVLLAYLIAFGVKLGQRIVDLAVLFAFADQLELAFVAVLIRQGVDFDFFRTEFLKALSRDLFFFSHGALQNCCFY